MKNSLLQALATADEAQDERVELAVAGLCEKVQGRGSLSGAECLELFAELAFPEAAISPELLRKHFTCASAFATGGPRSSRPRTSWTRRFMRSCAMRLPGYVELYLQQQRRSYF